MLENAKKYYFASTKSFKNELDVAHGFLKENYRIGMHMQEFFEINIITRGRGKHHIEENCLDAEVGDVFIIPPMVRHGYTGGEGFDVFHLIMSDKFIAKNMNELKMLPSFFILFTAEPLVRTKAEEGLHLKLGAEQFGEIKPLLDQMRNFPDTKISFCSLVRSGLALAVIALLCKAYTENNETPTENRKDSSFINAISYIHENYHEKLSIDKLAEIARLSRSSFVHKFKAICKTTPLEYINERRIKEAEHMLLNTKLSLLDIAFKCGFYDASHFSRTFLKLRGVSPSVYRRESMK